MTPVEVVIVCWAVASILACSFCALLIACAIVGDILRAAGQSGTDEPAVVPTGLRLCPRDEVGDRRALREGGRVA